MILRNIVDVCDGCRKDTESLMMDPQGYLVCTWSTGYFKLSCQYLARGLSINIL